MIFGSFGVSLKSCVHKLSVVRCAGLMGSINRSSAPEVKREEKEDEENCSITDKSEDEKKDVKARLGTRCLKHFICFIPLAFIYIFPLFNSL